jgi:EAL domain-containing protein (putative c-di-GMP-specific phosphodiesterase class I)
MSKVGCAGCKGGDALPFDFTMAFHPIVDIAQGSVWGYEALVRGTEGQGAGQILGMCPTSAPVGQIEGLHERRMAGSS